MTDCKLISIAPMMDWTDRHCRYLHRLMSRRALLHTEMITASALVHGPAARLLRHHPAEHPVALQLGGSDPRELAHAARLGAEAGYDEINLNVGCPSDRVQSGTFGACLMREPGLVADCAAAMMAAVPDTPVTVKCRTGVDEQDPEVALPDFLARIAAAGVRRVIIHARKAWLEGLSPRENREIPPLDYAIVHRMKAAFPSLHVSVNGGIASLAEAEGHLAAGLDGVMIGRAAYHDPAAILPGIDPLVAGEPEGPGPDETIRAMLPYIEAELSAGTHLNQISRHMLGLFAGRPGARQWRRVLSENAHRPGAGPELLEAALAAMTARAA
ncbi:MAG TPA: tRNA dihydrouridine(20/20a) synthase DusA [Paracoccaceae bacterium]|nr:tRNA dihydrouridine(20/20a) synthase DusA [Paracoccaceae bacterium]